MLRRLLVLAFVACAALGLRSSAYVDEVVVEAVGEGDGCCPCAEDGSPDDGCCASASCACFPGAALGDAPRLAILEGSPVELPVVAWALGAEQRARDRASAPPTRPPIG